MTTHHDIKTIMAERQQMFLFFSQVFFKELSRELIEHLSVADFAVITENERLNKGHQLLQRYFTFSGSDRRTELACEYARIFLAAGVYTETRDVAVPYESVFTSEEQLMMQDARDDVCRWYLREGFMVSPDVHEPEDHLALELEFMAKLCDTALRLLEKGEGEGDVRRGAPRDARGARGGAPRDAWGARDDCSDLVANLENQRAFINAHLLNWLPRLRKAAERYAELTFYIGMLLITEGYLQEDLMLLDELERSITKAPARCVI